jgi:hypothetical protein
MDAYINMKTPAMGRYLYVDLGIGTLAVVLPTAAGESQDLSKRTGEKWW